MSEATLHQYKNALRLVLKQAYVDGHIEEIPAFPDVMRQKRQDNRPRVHFSNSEYRKLLDAARRNIAAHRHRDSRWLSDAEELYDYIIFMANTGLLVSESNALRFKDVLVVPFALEIKGRVEQEQVCEITVTKGKRGGFGRCQSFIGAPKAFQRIVARRGVIKPRTSDELVFVKHQTAAFRKLLRDAGLYADAYGRKRDFVSLRATYICFRLASGVSLFDVAQNTRTSAVIIQQRYASALAPSRERMNITAWGREK